MKRPIILTLTLLIAIILPSSCQDDDMFDDRGDIFMNLTSVTWFTETSGRLPDRREFYACDYWDFFGDGTGVWESYYEEEGFPPRELRCYFDWDFTPEDYSIISLYIPGVGEEYWMIDRLTPTIFSAYVSQFDPNYTPDPPHDYQILYALQD
ncbi:hypothetical protein [uncultured Duncaniella sp.]|uniref:hypothetical protein n=1 Tax=uncultured Duncaniella sp. TaxID=2768039 RepID=UPI0026284F7F|nr:hypothetical protein [uncultured Duncaniella sp.]